MSGGLEVPDLLFNGPEGAPRTLVLAHGAGAPMDSPFMDYIALGLADDDLRVVRFEFPYMAARRRENRKRPPDRAPRLLETWRAVAAEVGTQGLVIGGKSLGGRMASLIADEIGAAGLVCLGYPFHPPGKPERLRTEHLGTIETPTLIVQGTRDALGKREEVESYRLSPAIRLFWAEDGDHSLVPRKSSGRTAEQNWDEAIGAVSEFVSSR